MKQWLMLCLLAVSLSVHAALIDDLTNAIERDNPSDIAKLLGPRGDVNQTNARGQGLLQLALLHESEKAAEWLLKQPKLDLNKKSQDGETPLMMAAFRGKAEMVKSMIKAGAQVNQPGWTALHYAATNGHKAIVALLLEEFAYIDAEAPSKTTPLMMAARHGHIEVVKLLLEEGADTRVKNVHNLSAIDFANMSQRPDIAEAIAAEIRKTNLRRGWD
jgi:uncharacterized protein